MSTTGSSLSPDALADTVAASVADAVRAALQLPAGSTTDDATSKTDVDAAADQASVVVRAALAKHLPALQQSTQLPPISLELTALLARLMLGSGGHTGPEPAGSTPPPNAPVLDDAARASLHAQAVAVLNVKALVPVTLDLAAGNYARWRGLFLVVLGKYALTDHVLCDAPRPDLAEWVQMDCVVLGWLYGAISPDLLQEVLSPTAIARSVWRDLEFQFLGNCELRAVNLSAEFHGFQQGDLSVSEYCRRLKTMADNLADLGEPQSDRTLVLTLINGLSPKFGHMQSLLPMQQPFPSFIQARSQLLLKEITKGPRPANDSATTFVATMAGAGGTPSGRGGTGNTGGSQGGSGSASVNSPNRRRGGCGNGGGGGNTSNSVAANPSGGSGGASDGQSAGSQSA